MWWADNDSFGTTKNQLGPIRHRDSLLDQLLDATGLDGWRVDVGYPEDRERAEALLRGKEPAAVEE